MTTRKMNGRSGRKTRRSDTGMTVEALHRSFEAIDDRVRAMMEKGASDAQMAVCISKAWADHFHSDISGPAVDGLITHYRATHKGKRFTRRRKQRGSGATSPAGSGATSPAGSGATSPAGSGATRPSQRGGMAPIDWTMGQGTTAPTYGHFIAEMGKTPAALASLDTVNRFFESPISRSCNDTGGAPPPTQRGGSLWAAATTPQAPMTSPPNAIQSALYGLQTGQAIGPSASPISTHAPTITAALSPYDTTQIHRITNLAPVGSY